MFKLFKAETIKRGAFCLTAFLCLVAGAAPADAVYGRVRVDITNNSSYDIYEIHMSPTGDGNWERDLLRDDVLTRGASTTVTAVPGRYDLKLVDEDGDACVVMNLPLYGDEAWSITNRWLLSCEFHN